VNLTDINFTTYSSSVKVKTVISKKKVKKVIWQPVINRMSDIFWISNKMLRKEMKKLITSVHHLFNVCIKHEYHSKIFRKVNIIVLHKFNKKNYTDSKTYHLITLLNTLSKTLKSIMITRISNFVKLHQLLLVTQMKNRQKKSTVTALKLLMKQMHTVWNKDEKNVAIVLSLNMVKAFDYVNHERLLYNLHKKDISEYLVKWMVSFLSEKAITLFFNDQTTALHQINIDIF